VRQLLYLSDDLEEEEKTVEEESSSTDMPELEELTPVPLSARLQVEKLPEPRFSWYDWVEVDQQTRQAALSNAQNAIISIKAIQDLKKDKSVNTIIVPTGLRNAFPAWYNALKGIATLIGGDIVEAPGEAISPCPFSSFFEATTADAKTAELKRLAAAGATANITALAHTSALLESAYRLPDPASLDQPGTPITTVQAYLCYVLAGAHYETLQGDLRRKAQTWNLTFQRARDAIRASLTIMAGGREKSGSALLSSLEFALRRLFLLALRGEVRQIARFQAHTVLGEILPRLLDSPVGIFRRNCPRERKKIAVETIETGRKGQKKIVTEVQRLMHVVPSVPRGVWSPEEENIIAKVNSAISSFEKVLCTKDELRARSDPISVAASIGAAAENADVAMSLLKRVAAARKRYFRDIVFKMRSERLGCTSTDSGARSTTPAATKATGAPAFSQKITTEEWSAASTVAFDRVPANWDSDFEAGIAYLVKDRVAADKAQSILSSANSETLFALITRCSPEAMTSAARAAANLN
jgi:hypothetical protein